MQLIAYGNPGTGMYLGLVILASPFDIQSTVVHIDIGLH